MKRLLPMLVLIAACSLVTTAGGQNVQRHRFLAGAAVVDISPLEFPVIINGGMTERTADKIVDRLQARGFVLDDGSERIALVIVDSCMLPRELLDEAKELASQATGIPTQRMMISATHTHSAPAAMGCLGSDRDERYARFLAPQLAKAIQLANDARQPARIGWAFGRDEKNVACRRWEMKAGAAPTNPFGGTHDDRAQMHPGFNNPNALRATGEPDPELPVIALQTLDGKPLGLIAAYSLHYVGSSPVSADYFGAFCDRMAEAVGGDKPAEKFFPALANATSGDMWLMDYSKPEGRQFDQFSVAKEVAAAAFEAYQEIDFMDWVPLIMEEKEVEIAVRMPSDQEVQQARQFAASFAGRKPNNVPEVYARETLLLSEMPPARVLKLQAIRIGNLGIAAIPNEVFAETGLKIKRTSPLKQTFTIELANGAEGYIPPAEQHLLGGYTTWRARTSCLEPNAESIIRNTALQLLRQVADVEKIK